MTRDGALRISVGREFQRVGAMTLKALSPKVCMLVWGAVSGAGYRGGEGQMGTEGMDG